MSEGSRPERAATRMTREGSDSTVEAVKGVFERAPPNAQLKVAGRRRNEGGRRR